MMNIIEHSGTELALRTVEKMVPIIDWWAHLNKVAAQCIANLKKSFIKASRSNMAQEPRKCIIACCKVESTKKSLELGAKKKGLPREKEEERGKSNKCYGKLKVLKRRVAFHGGKLEKL